MGGGEAGGGNGFGETLLRLVEGPVLNGVTGHAMTDSLHPPPQAAVNFIKKPRRDIPPWLSNTQWTD